MTDTATSSYLGTFDGHLVPGRKVALLIVDVVMAYLDPGSPLFCETAAMALSSNERLLEAARTSGTTTVFTRVEYQVGGLDGGQFYRKVPILRVFDKGSELGAFPDGLTPGEYDIVVTKQYASAFFGTSLASTLCALGVDTVLITGYSTSGCVRATALDAVQLGFAPFVVRDACADRHPGPHEANLFDLQAKYAEVLGEACALAIIAASRNPD